MDIDHMTGEEIMVAAMASRIKAGLWLRFRIPGRDEIFDVYPKDAAQKERFQHNAKTKGWTAVDD